MLAITTTDCSPSFLSSPYAVSMYVYYMLYVMYAL
jgi:hypothetical protein